MKLLITGDFSPGGRLSTLTKDGRYDDILGGVKDVISSADYSIVNFETCVAGEDDTPIVKSGPNLRCSSEAVGLLSLTGFNAVTLANNHFRDYGDAAVVRTIQLLKDNHIDYVGGGADIREASQTLIKEIIGKRIAIINACEHEYSIASYRKGGCNPLNPIQQYYAIRKARENVDIVIVIIHGGHEHYQLPSPRMQETYRFFVDSGADAVINHHQHCFSGYEEYNGKPIFYGLGNFCFDKIHEGLPNAWHEGYMVELNFEDDGHVGYKLIPYIQCKDKPSVELMRGRNYDIFFSRIKKLNAIIGNPVELKKEHEAWMEANGSAFEFQYLPYNNHWLLSAYIRHLFPSFLSKNRLLNLQNHLECESHRERSLFALNKLLNHN